MISTACGLKPRTTSAGSRGSETSNAIPPKFRCSSKKSLAAPSSSGLKLTSVSPNLLSHLRIPIAITSCDFHALFSQHLDKLFPGPDPSLEQRRSQLRQLSAHRNSAHPKIHHVTLFRIQTASEHDQIVFCHFRTPRVSS